MRKLHILPCMVLWASIACSYAMPESERQFFIDTYAEMAIVEMKTYGIPASITLAQAILESSWGQGPVAREANNFFCIKCNNGWSGPTFDSKDDEPGLSCFRKYGNIEESFRDHSLFLRENIRYQPLFRHSLTDYASWARELKACGYATDPLYAEKLIGLIESYGLYLYDKAITAGHFNYLDTPWLTMAEMEETEIKEDPYNPDRQAHDQVNTQPVPDLTGEEMPAPVWEFSRFDPGSGRVDMPAQEERPGEKIRMHTTVLTAPVYLLEDL